MATFLLRDLYPDNIGGLGPTSANSSPYQVQNAIYRHNARPDIRSSGRAQVLKPSAISDQIIADPARRDPPPLPFDCPSTFARTFRCN